MERSQAPLREHLRQMKSRSATLNVPYRVSPIALASALYRTIALSRYPVYTSLLVALSTIALLYYRTAVLSHYCTTALLHYCTIVWSLSFTALSITLCSVLSDCQSSKDCQTVRLSDFPYYRLSEFTTRLSDC
jgi:hypothetical protein